MCDKRLLQDLRAHADTSGHTLPSHLPLTQFHDVWVVAPCHESKQDSNTNRGTDGTGTITTINGADIEERNGNRLPSFSFIYALAKRQTPTGGAGGGGGAV